MRFRSDRITKENVNILVRRNVRRMVNLGITTRMENNPLIQYGETQSL